MKLPDSFPVEIKHGNVTVKIYRTANKGYEEFKLVYYGVRRTITNLRSRLDAFAEAFRCLITDVTAQDLERYIGSIQGEDRTKFNQARLIRTLFNFAQSRKYFPKDVDVAAAYRNGRSSNSFAILAPDACLLAGSELS